MRAFVRDISKIPEDLKSKIEAVVGDVTDAKQVANAVAGRDAVVVVLGTGRDLSKHKVSYFLIFIRRYTYLLLLFSNDMPHLFVLHYFKALLPCYRKA